MVAMTIPYIVPLFLGMTFDARSYSPGVTIFDEADIAKADSVRIGTSKSLYTIVSQNSEIRDALEMAGDLALKIKTGNVDIKGAGSYIKNVQGLHNSVIILTTFKYTSRATSLGSAEPISNWFDDFSKEILGTHYVDGVVYGVEMVAALKFTASNSSTKDEIKAQIQQTLADKGKAKDLTVSGNLDKVLAKVKGKSKLEISYFGTLPLRQVNNSIEGFKDLIVNFGKYVKEAGLEDGLPQSVILKELANLPGGEDVPEFQYVVNSLTKSRFETFQDQYLRLSEAKANLFSWSRSLPFDLSEASSEKFAALAKELGDDMSLCYALISKVVLSGDPSILDGDQSIINKNYMLKVKQLMKEIEIDVAENAQVTTDTYIHWGNDNCMGSETTKLFDGYTIGSTKEGIGGMVNYDCMPSNGNWSAYELNDTDYESLITGITYGTISETDNPFKGDFARYINDSAVPCAKCHQLDASMVTMFTGTTECPLSWDLKYTGYLMSGLTDIAHTTEYICIDDTPSDLRTLEVDDKQNSMALTVVRNGGSLPETFVTNQLVPCAVCAMKGGLIL